MKQPKTKEAAAQEKTKSTVWNAPKARAPDGGAILRQKTRQAGRAAAEKPRQTMAEKESQCGEESGEHLLNFPTRRSDICLES